MMNNYLRMNQANWRSKLVQYSQFLIHWGWFVILSIILITLCSSLIPNVPSVDTYQATLHVQVQIGSTNSGELSLTTTLFSNLFMSPDTVSLALPELNKLEQFKDLQLSDLQGSVTATPVTGTRVIVLTAVGVTREDASILVTDVYQAFLQRIHSGHSVVSNGLHTALVAELKQDENDLANSTATLQNLTATGQASSFQYQLVSNLHREQLFLVNTINSLLVTLGQQGFGTHDIVETTKARPDITTVPATLPTQSLRIALSPLVGLIMGLCGALLASQFSNRLPLRGKKRESILPHVTGYIPVLPKLRSNRSQALQQAASVCLPLLRHLRYQASEHEKRLRLITITSPQKREGKSTVATSLATAAALSGLHTILVDANPGRPVLHTWFRSPNASGTLEAIDSLAAGIADPSPLVNTSTTKLDLVPIGNANQKRSSTTLVEALRIDGLQPFVELLSNQADLIIFDGPSLLGDTDAVNLITLSDVVLLVVDVKKSRSSKVLEAETLLSEIGVSFSTVLNRARQEYLA